MTNDDGNGAGAGYASAGLGVNPDPREALQWIVATYGMPVATDLRRLKPLLSDLCSSRKRENLLLINAAQEGIPAQLLSAKSSLLPAELLLSRLSQHLEENLLVTHHVARWAVESWALALGRITAEELTTQQLIASPAQTPVKPSTPPVKPKPPPVPPDPEIEGEAEEEHAAAVVVPPIIDSVIRPDPDRGWNWSAFFLGWVWLFGHKIWRWGISSFLVCLLICILSQWYVPFLHGDNTLYSWETHIGTALTYKTNAALQTEFTPETFGIPLVEYGVVLLTFLPIGLFGNRLVPPGTASRDLAYQTRAERRWRWWGFAALILGPLLFRVENGVMDRIIETFFPT